MKMRRLIKRFTGFTLIEIIIASAIFTMFMTGVFSFYRMGSRMFVSGSWKLNKQKETERFMSILKERIEQASNATQIDPGGGPGSVIVAPCNFLTLNNGTTISEIDGEKRLMLFTVCKPDMTKVAPANNDYRGLILYHALVAVPDHAPTAGGPEKNLYTLFFHADTNPDAVSTIDYFNSPETFKPDTTAMANFPAGFANLPSFFSYGTVPQTFKLSEIASANISWGLASGTDSSNSDKVLGIRLRMVNEKHPETSVNHEIQAKVDYSVPLINYNLGDF